MPLSKDNYPMPLVGIVLSRSRGFSLLELLVALGIIAIILAASVPILSSARNSYRLLTARDEFMGTLETMRTTALKREVGTTITVTENGDYTAQFEQNGMVQTLRYSLPPNVTFTLPSGVTTLTILCRPTGKVTVTGNNGARVTTITMSNPAGQRTVTVNLLGQIAATFATDAREVSA